MMAKVRRLATSRARISRSRSGVVIVIDSDMRGMNLRIGTGRPDDRTGTGPDIATHGSITFFLVDGRGRARYIQIARQLTTTERSNSTVPKRNGVRGCLRPACAKL